MAHQTTVLSAIARQCCALLTRLRPVFVAGGEGSTGDFTASPLVLLTDALLIASTTLEPPVILLGSCTALPDWNMPRRSCHVFVPVGDDILISRRFVIEGKEIMRHHKPAYYLGGVHVSLGSTRRVSNQIINQMVVIPSTSSSGCRGCRFCGARNAPTQLFALCKMTPANGRHSVCAK